MTLQPDEAAVLIVCRSDRVPGKYFFALRRSRFSFDHASHDFQLQGPQEAVKDLGTRADFQAALDEAVAEIRTLYPSSD